MSELNFVGIFREIRRNFFFEETSTKKRLSFGLKIRKVLKNIALHVQLEDICANDPTN